MNTAATIIATSSSPEPASSTKTPTKAIATTPTKAIATTLTVTTTPATTTSTLPPIVYRPPTMYSVVCTVDCNIRMVVPPDGVCDFIFFDSLYVTCGGGVGDAQTTPKLQRFFDLAAQGNDTQFGCSIDALQLGDFVTDIGKSDSLKWAQEKLWANNVYHWGVMNIYHVLYFQDPDIVKKALEALKGDAAVLANCLRQAQDIQSPLAISFTLKARMYQPEVKRSIDETMYKKCVPGNFSQDVDPIEFCDLVKKGYVSGPSFVNVDKTIISFVTTPERTTVVYFDSTDTLRVKICQLKYQALHLTVSLAPYDVNYDFDSFYCNSVSNFSRTVHIATTVLDFLKNSFTDGARKLACNALGRPIFGR
ncbi:uncharacterized protein [Dermacentor andersoni]|uniref:uncharacterized protein isoform X2 n=1 Tax=Dermacentor andersoni TaxID=34620 RepID=UPI003B3A0CF3